MNDRDRREQNRRSWNAVVPAHRSHQPDLARWLRNGGSTLFPEELTLLGELRGRTLAHLLCNTGADTLSLAQHGATVTGIDISEAAIDEARRLAAASGIAAHFERADVYDWLSTTAATDQRFDRVYAGYGTVCWLPDLTTWAEGIANVLTDGGRFVLIDFHPTAMIFDRGWQHADAYYAAGAVLPIHGVDDYVAYSADGLTPSGFDPGITDFRNPEPCFLYRWGLGEIVTALVGAGLRLTALNEYPYSNGERLFADMRAEGRRMFPPEHVPSLPLMYGIAGDKVGR
jgi:SAM-dependent methyltransferase